MAENFVSSVSSEEFDKALLGGLDAANGKFAKKEEIPTVPVQSVNGKTGNVDLIAADVGADPAGTAVDVVALHNVAPEAHNDIRLLIEGLVSRLNALADSDDTTLDQMSEIVTYIKANKTLIDSITTSKVNVSDIINNLTTNVSNKPLSAAQGVILKGLIDSLSLGKLDVTAIADWAKATTKPSYTKSEVGLGNVDNVKQYSTSNPPPYPVTSVNGATGAVTVEVPEIVQATGDSETAVMSQKAVTDALDAIPSYVVEEAEATLAKAASHGILGRTIRFIAISDTHEDSEESYNPQITVSNRHAGQAIAYISDRIGLDFIAHLGDVSSAGSFLTEYQFATLRKDIENINKFLSPGSRGIPNVRLVGNHDQFYTTDGKRLFNSGAYNYFGRFCEGNKDTVGGYGYFDLDSAKVRVVYLNTSDIQSATTAGTILAMTDAQKNWLCETLIALNEKDDAADWKILLMSHAPLDFGGTTNIATDILLAYVNGESYGDYAFTKHDAQIISNVHGHVHCYSYGYMAGKIRRFTIPNACFVGNNHYGSRSEFESWVDTETYHKTANTGKDTAFSLVTIDLDRGICYADNYGAGIDREFSTEYFSDEEKPLLNLNRTYEAGPTGEYVDGYLDESKAYTNVQYSSLAFYSQACTVSDASENSVTIKESGAGGVAVAYAIHLPGIATNAYRISFDYSGAGKCRSYYRYAKEGGKSGNASLFIDDTAGTSGHADVEIPHGGGYDWLVITFTSNTGQTKTFTNVSLTKVE